MFTSKNYVESNKIKITIGTSLLRGENNYNIKILFIFTKNFMISCYFNGCIICNIFIIIQNIKGIFLVDKILFLWKVMRKYSSYSWDLFIYRIKYILLTILKAVL